MPAQTRWRLHDRLLLRRAGFGVHLMTDLGDPPTARACAELVERERELESVRAHLLDSALPAAVSRAAGADDRAALRRWSALRGDVGRKRRPRAAEPVDGPLGEPVRRYADAVEAVAAARKAVTRSRDAEARHRPGRLAAFLRTRGVQDALVQLTPSFHAQVERWLAAPEPSLDRAKGRAFARRCYLYAQRLGAKNETTSSFGPLVHGRVDPGARDLEIGTERGADDGLAEGVLRVRSHVSFWAVTELARAMAADPRVAPRVPVTWVPAAHRDGTRVTLPGGRSFSLSESGRRLAEAVDSERDRTALAEAAGIDEAEAERLLTRLTRAGAVRTWPEPPSTELSPISVLRRDADRIAHDTDWPRRLAEFCGLADAYAYARGPHERLAALRAVEEGFRSLTGADPRRAAGRMYADRSVVSVDAEGEGSPFLVGDAVARAWEDALSPVLDLAGRYGTLYRDAYRDLAAELLHASGPIPYQELIDRMAAAVAEGVAARHLKPFEEFAERYRALVEDCLDDDGTARIPAERLRDLAGPPDSPLFASPDVMVEEGADGRRALVLGELHPYVFAWGSQGLFAEDDPGFHRAFTEDLAPWGGPERIATVVRRRSHKGLVASWFPGRFVEVTAVATRDRDRALPIGDLTVDLRDGLPRLLSPGGEVVLYSGEDDHPHLLAFSTPAPMLPAASLGPRSPRVTVGDVVVARARFHVQVEELGITPGAGDHDVLHSVQSFRARHGAPRYVFAHVPGEPKPIGVDLGSPLPVEALVRLVTAGRATSLTLTEMRPGPESLWLRHHGRPTTSEFRLALLREAR
ncbi:lantibiotic dehydratase [Nocardiopsis alba]|uniref:lantibiotic dehydratase n=1 Tax=Nocardiopsis alba TaxID=53437 RepID=UPI003646C43C